VKIVVQVKLLPTPEQAAALESTLHACNAAATEVAGMARELGCYRNYDLRKLAYHAVKADYGLGAQAAQHVIKKVCDAYATLRANIRAGNLGKPGSRRREQARTEPIRFRPTAAQPYDARMLSWQHDQRTVSIWTTAGRLRQVAFTGSPDHLDRVATLPVGECDLVYRDGMWFLHATVELPKAEQYEPAGFLGVDKGHRQHRLRLRRPPLRRRPAPRLPASPATAPAPVAGQGTPRPPGGCWPADERRKRGTPRTPTTASPRAS